jgi:hypothetical protein
MFSSEARGSRNDSEEMKESAQENDSNSAGMVNWI